MVRGLIRTWKQVMELPEEERRGALLLVARILRRSEDGLCIPEREAQELRRLQGILFFQKAEIISDQVEWH